MVRRNNACSILQPPNGRLVENVLVSLFSAAIALLVVRVAARAMAVLARTVGSTVFSNASPEPHVAISRSCEGKRKDATISSASDPRSVSGSPYTDAANPPLQRRIVHAGAISPGREDHGDLDASKQHLRGYCSRLHVHIIDIVVTATLQDDSTFSGTIKVVNARLVASSSLLSIRTPRSTVHM